MNNDRNYQERWDRQLIAALEESAWRIPKGKTEEDAELDLNVVARQVLATILRERKWSQNYAHKKLGISQRSVGRFIKGVDGWTLESLSKVLRGLDTDLVPFFRSHPEIGGHRARTVRAVRNEVLDRFRVSLSPGERLEIVQLIEEARENEAYERAVAAFYGVVATVREALSRAKSRAKNR